MISYLNKEIVTPEKDIINKEDSVENIQTEPKQEFANTSPNKSGTKKTIRPKNRKS